MTHNEGMALENPLKATTIGELCGSIRNREGITQTDMGKLIGVTRNTITRTEMGMIERPYDYLSYILKWMSDKETAHMLELLRAIDLKHLYNARLELATGPSQKQDNSQT